MTQADRKLTPMHWMLPVALLALGTVVVWVGNLDLRISELFYQPTGGEHWPVGERALWQFLYRWGELPAVVMGIVACLMIAFSAVRRGRARLNWAGVVLLGALVLGPLVTTNGLLKSYYGRPRPQETSHFDGNRQFRPVLLPSFRQDEDSFPSGHAAAGFALLLPYFVLRRRHPRLAVAVLAGGLGFGTLMGVARVAQGGHYASDVMWAGGVVYFSGWVLSRWRESREAASADHAERGWDAQRRYVVFGVALAGAALIGVAYLLRQPFSLTQEWVVPIRPSVREAHFEIEFITRNGKTRIVPEETGGPLRITTTASGRGLPFTPIEESRQLQMSRNGDTSLRYEVMPRWSTIRFSSRMVVRAPKGMQLSIRQPDGTVVPIRVGEPLPEALESGEPLPDGTLESLVPAQSPEPMEPGGAPDAPVQVTIPAGQPPSTR